MEEGQQGPTLTTLQERPEGFSWEEALAMHFDPAVYGDLKELIRNLPAVWAGERSGAAV